MHLIYITVWLDPSDPRTSERAVQTLKLDQALNDAALGHVSDIRYNHTDTGIGIDTAITVSDADSTLPRVVDVMRRFSLCEEARVLIRYGGPSAPERQFTMSELLTIYAPAI